MNIKKWLNKYSDDYYWETYGNHSMNIKEWFDKAECFLCNYSISEEEYQHKCLPITKRVFTCSASDSHASDPIYPRQIFHQGFLRTISFFSPIFDEETWILTQRISKTYGDKYWYVVEEECCEEEVDTAIKLKIPLDISWEALMDGGVVFDVLFKMPYNNYYFFGDSGKWGKWCDYESFQIDYEMMGCISNIPAFKAYKDTMFNKGECLAMINKLLSEWNPIGVPDEIADVEYLNYIPMIMTVINDEEATYKYLMSILKDISSDESTVYSKKTMEDVHELTVKLHQLLGTQRVVPVCT